MLVLQIRCFLVGCCSACEGLWTWVIVVGASGMELGCAAASEDFCFIARSSFVCSSLRMSPVFSTFYLRSNSHVAAVFA